MKKQISALALAIAGMGTTGVASAALSLDFIQGTPIPAPYVTYGDGNSYSLPVLGILYELAPNILAGTTPSQYPKSIGPTNPYYYASSPGAISDFTVIGTGTNNNGVVTNFPGMDNAYATPNSSGINYFGTPSAPDPGGAGQFTGDAASTWDVRLDSFASFLGTNNAPVFMFNNNQVSSGAATNQSLAVWAALTLYDDQGLLDPLTFYFTNLNKPYALVGEGGGGTVNGTAGNGTLGTPTGPIAGTNTATDYVLSGGALCYSAAYAVISCKLPDGSDNPAAVGGPINHNLGANQAVYAVVFPALNDVLGTSGFGGYDVLSIDWRMGCDPNTIDPATNCVGRSLNNGYEQLFITTTARDIPPPPPPIPEPASLALLGLGLLGLGAMRLRKQA